MTARKRRVIAIAAATGRIGCVLIVGTKIEKCTMLRRSGLTPLNAAVQTRRWIKIMKPEALVTENVGLNSRKARGTIANIHAIEQEGRVRSLVVKTVHRQKTLKSKYEEAAALAELYPEIKDILPQKRKCFGAEPRKMIYFEALSMYHKSVGGTFNR